MSSSTPSPVSQSNQSEIDKVLPNTLYLTLNAPKVDDYHRALFITYPPILCLSSPLTSGTLFHAAYVSSIWHLEKRAVADFASSNTLVLLWRIATLTGSPQSIREQFAKIEDVLNAVPLGKAEDEGRKGGADGDGERDRVGEGEEGERERQGNPELGGYDCVIWTRDALRRLVLEGLVVVKGKDIDQIMAEARAAAGPEDARAMVGKDFGGLRIFNDTL